MSETIGTTAGRPEATEQQRPALPVTVGLDTSPGGAPALEWAAREAMLRGVPLRVVRCYEWGLHDPWTGRTDAPMVHLLEEDARRLLRERRKDLVSAHPDLELITDARQGAAHLVLSHLHTESSLVVVGERHRPALEELVDPGLGAAVAARADLPVVMVPESPMPPAPVRRVVVAVHDGPEGAVAVRFAVDEARRRSVPLVAVRCWQPDFAAIAPAGQRSAEERLADRILEDALRDAADGTSGLRVERRLVRGRPAEELRDLAMETDLLVMGRQSARRHWHRLGSVTRHVLRAVPCAVAVVPLVVTTEEPPTA